MIRSWRWIWTSFWKIRKIRSDEALPSGVTIFVFRKFAPSADKSCFSGMNVSDPKQMSYKKADKLLLQTTDTWNTIFRDWCGPSSIAKNIREYTYKHTSNTKYQSTKVLSIDVCWWLRNPIINMRDYTRQVIWEENKLRIN